MAYARLGPESDVYVFEGINGIHCCGCSLSSYNEGGCDFIAKTPELMIRHMGEHRFAGDRVPETLIGALAAGMVDL